MHPNFYFILFLCFCPLCVKSQDCLFQQENKITLPFSFSNLKGLTTINIAVVVHIIEKENNSIEISDRLIIDQISALNRDFNLLNNEWRFLPEEIKNTAASANIHFHLANNNPEGEETSGITRTKTNFQNFDTYQHLYQTNKGGHDPWANDKYLNIWVTELSERLLGFSSSPSDINSISDGVVINSRVFGIRPSANPSYLGRSLVHEVGHYLGLLHPWGYLSEECEEDDGLIDTPKQSGPHRGCPPSILNGCETEQPIYWNFMDYTPDCCMALFTKEQVSLMRYISQTTRASLANFGEYDVNDINDISFSKNIIIYPNPASGVFSIDWSEKAKETNIKFISLIIYGLNGRELVSLPLSRERERIELCTDSLPKGILFLKAITEEGAYEHIGKLVVF